MYYSLSLLLNVLSHDLLVLNAFENFLLRDFPKPKYRLLMHQTQRGASANCFQVVTIRRKMLMVDSWEAVAECQKSLLSSTRLDTGRLEGLVEIFENLAGRESAITVSLF